MKGNAWPADVDGDVFRRLESHGFDFGRLHEIDFNVDLEKWPPDPALVDLLKKEFRSVTLHEPKNDGRGYIGVVVEDKLTYEMVMAAQKYISVLAAPFGGVCDSWGVFGQ